MMIAAQSKLVRHNTTNIDHECCFDLVETDMFSSLIFIVLRRLLLMLFYGIPDFFIIEIGWVVKLFDSYKYAVVSFFIFLSMFFIFR